jgi:hypothetical protein
MHWNRVMISINRQDDEGDPPTTAREGEARHKAKTVIPVLVMRSRRGVRNLLLGKNKGGGIAPADPIRGSGLAPEGRDFRPR